MNLKKEREFKYYLQQIFEGSDIDEELVKNITANISSKASRNSIDEAIEYKNEHVENGDIPEDISEKIEKLLIRFSFWR